MLPSGVVVETILSPKYFVFFLIRGACKTHWNIYESPVAGLQLGFKFASVLNFLSTAMIAATDNTRK